MPHVTIIFKINITSLDKVGDTITVDDGSVAAQAFLKIVMPKRSVNDARLVPNQTLGIGSTSDPKGFGSDPSKGFGSLGWVVVL